MYRVRGYFCEYDAQAGAFAAYNVGRCGAVLLVLGGALAHDLLCVPACLCICGSRTTDA